MDDSDSRPDEPTKADTYRHGDALEVVFAVEDGRVLTVREYPTVETFEDAVAGATYTGTHDDVASIPNPLDSEAATDDSA